MKSGRERERTRKKKVVVDAAVGRWTCIVNECSRGSSHVINCHQVISRRRSRRRREETDEQKINF